MAPSQIESINEAVHISAGPELKRDQINAVVEQLDTDEQVLAVAAGFSDAQQQQSLIVAAAETKLVLVSADSASFISADALDAIRIEDGRSMSNIVLIAADRSSVAGYQNGDSTVTATSTEVTVYEAPLIDARRVAAVAEERWGTEVSYGDEHSINRIELERELKRLERWRNQGLITPEQYEVMRENLLKQYGYDPEEADTASGKKVAVIIGLGLLVAALAVWLLITAGSDDDEEIQQPVTTPTPTEDETTEPVEDESPEPQDPATVTEEAQPTPTETVTEEAEDEPAEEPEPAPEPDIEDEVTPEEAYEAAAEDITDIVEDYLSANGITAGIQDSSVEPQLIEITLSELTSSEDDAVEITETIVPDLAAFVPDDADGATHDVVVEADFDDPETEEQGTSYGQYQRSTDETSSGVR